MSAKLANGRDSTIFRQTPKVLQPEVRLCPDRPHQNYASHSYEDLATQPIHQIGRGYEAGNDANSLRHDAVFELRAAILPFGDDAVSCTLQTVPPIPISKW